MIFTPRLKKLLITAGVLLAFLPVWSLAIAPQIFPEVACVVQAPNGELVKAWGETNCSNNEQAIVVFKAD